MSTLKKLNTSFLFTKVHASSLAFIRIAMGLVLLRFFCIYYYYITDNLAHSLFFNTYDCFHWVKMGPPFLMKLLFNLGIVTSFCVVIGFQYRFNSIITCLLYLYIFYLDKGHYNNHHYLYGMFAFFFTVVDAHKWGSVDAWLRKDDLTKKYDPYIPFWQIFIFQLQIFIVYFYGGLAKLHTDWLKGFPMRFWLYDNAMSHYPTWIGNIVKTEIGALVISWGGIVFDLSVGFLLFSKRFRKVAVLPVVFFHGMNNVLWMIGSFPAAMISTTTIFFDPDWFKKVIDWLKDRPLQSLKHFFTSNFIKKTFLFFSPFHYQKSTKAKVLFTTPALRKKITLGLLTLWFSFQLLFPFQRFVLPGHPSWTGEGHLFAWRMMLVDTLDAIKVKIIISDTQEEFSVDLLRYMNIQQFRKLLRTPKSLLRFCHFIRDELKTKGGIEDPIIKLEVYKSVNERPPKLLVDTTLNYAKIPYQTWKHSEWFTDWKESDVEPEFNLDKFAHWKRLKEVSDLD